MIEAPEAVCLSRQLNDAVCGKYISEVVVFHSPHKFTFISPGIDYEGVLLGKRVGKARARGGMVELAVGERALLFSDGANLTYLNPVPICRTSTSCSSGSGTRVVWWCR